MLTTSRSPPNDTGFDKTVRLGRWSSEIGNACLSHRIPWMCSCLVTDTSLGHGSLYLTCFTNLTTEYYHYSGDNYDRTPIASEWPPSMAMYLSYITRSSALMLIIPYSLWTNYRQFSTIKDANYQRLVESFECATTIPRGSSSSSSLSSSH